MRKLNTTTTQSSSSSANLTSIMSSSNLLNTMSQRGLDWESLRKQARQLENEIDSKLVGFSKLCTSFSATKSSLIQSSGSASASGNAGDPSASSDLLFVTLSNEIEDALKKLTSINNRMSDSLNGDAVEMSSPSATVHTLQRHRDILRDYSTEYEKTKRNIINLKEREKLLSSSSSSRSANSGVQDNNLNNRRNEVNGGGGGGGGGANGGAGGSGDASTSLYMKEYDHLKSSHSLIDQQLEMAELTKENLQSQRQTLRLIQQKMNTLAHKFPMINNLVQRIKLKKRKDSIVLATVISVCLIIMLLYLF